MSVLEAIAGQRLVICVGPGGVGKTSFSAALALAAAADRRVALLTIDPARRLADALGVGLDDGLREVPGAPGLSAAMLDTKQSFDALVARLAAPEQATKIHDNAVYQAFSRTLARSHAYVAMERLHDLLDGPFDLVVVDTPPTRSALTILDAPDRLAAFLADDAVTEMLARGLGGRGAGLAARLFGLLAGRRLVDDMLAFFALFLPLRAGFAARAARTREALQGAAFLLVAAPEPAHLHDAGHLRAELRARGLPPAAVVFNRAFVPGVGATPLGDDDEVARRLERLAPEPHPSREELRRALERVAAVCEREARFNRDTDRAIAAFLDGERAYALPRLDREPCDVEALRAMIAAARCRESRLTTD